MKHPLALGPLVLAICLATLNACGVGAVGGANALATSNQNSVTVPHSSVTPVPVTGGNDTISPSATYLLRGRFAPGNANLLAPQAMSWGHSAVVARVTHTTQVSVSLSQVQGTGAYSLMAQNETDSTASVASMSFDPNTATGSLSGLDPCAIYTLTFLKHIEAMYSTLTFRGFVLDANANYLAAPTDAPRRMEVIGDSISCGYGDLGTVATCTALPTNEDSEDAYGPVAAATLGADLHLLAWSGKGLYLNVDTSVTDTMPDIWRRSDATDANTTWNTSSWTPQVVVINLGTNDFTNAVVDGNAFVSTYTSFLTTLRTAYPQAAIIVSIGPMLQGTALATCEAYLQTAIDARSAAGDQAVYLLEYPIEDTNTGAGCAYHPNITTQASMASALVAKINTVVQW